jgi:hypothetical protein
MCGQEREVKSFSWEEWMMIVTDKAHVLTEEDYRVAEQNGICRKTLYTRFYIHYWNKEDALTRPVRKQSKTEWRSKCKELGIVNLMTYDNRLRYGWDEEKAATTPPMTREQIAEQNRKRNRKYPDWVYKAMDDNGISQKTFTSRVNKNKWTVKEACTVPVGMTLVDYYRNRVNELESKSG